MTKFKLVVLIYHSSYLLMENKDDRLNVCAYIHRERERVNPRYFFLILKQNTYYYIPLYLCETWLEAKSFNAKWCILVNDLETGKLMEKYQDTPRF